MRPGSLLWGLCVLMAAGTGNALAGERTIGVELGAEEVGRYERLDVVLDVEAVGSNPFDPDEIDLRLELTTPSDRRLVVPAFWYQPFERRDLSRGRGTQAWLYPAGEPQWRVRFAPMEIGRHRCVARLTDHAGTAQSRPVAFECVPSESQGFLRVSKRDPRFFAFDGGQPFFAVGQDVAFIKSLPRQEAMLASLGAAGANFVRVWTCCQDWGMAIEARKSAWGRSWSWNPPVVPLPGSHGYNLGGLCVQLKGEAGESLVVNPSRRVALKPKTKYVLGGDVMSLGATVELQMQGVDLGEALPVSRKWQAFKREFTSDKNGRWMPRLSFRLASEGAALLRNLSLREAGGGYNHLWEADPNRPPRGVYNHIDCFMLDQIVEAAEAHGIYLELCLLTRDHYMHPVSHPHTAAYDEAVADAEKLLRYAVARWGYSTHVAAWEYWNEMNPGPPNHLLYDAWGTYLERIDPYRHLRAVSHWHPSPKYWTHPKLDMADEHFYMRPSTKELFKDAPLAVMDRAALLRKHASDKPALISEFGVLADNWRETEHLRKDKEFWHLHNALWASALSGLSGTVMHWFWDAIHKRDLYHHYTPVARFVADIPWTTAKLQPASARASDPKLRVIGLRGDGCAYLWLFHEEATWWKLGDGLKPKPVEGAMVELEGLAAGRYQVEWWDTAKGEVTGRETAQAKAGSL
ncbi:MAG: DUF5060 domain-containing protein, partial [Planctomycetota bacterium]